MTSSNSQIDRTKGIKAFSVILKHSKNCEILEKNIYKLVEQTEENDNKQDLYNWYTYQVAGLVLQQPNELKNIACDIKSGKLGWKCKIYDSIESKIQEHDDYLVKPFEVVDGVVRCPKCNGTKTWSVQKQTRSSDEPMTTFSRCVNCSHQWAYSG